MSAPTRPETGARPEVSLDELAERFELDGFAFPYRAAPEAEAIGWRRHVEELLATDPRASEHLRAYAHLTFPLVADITRDPRVLDAVEAVLGPDIMLWGASFILKAPRHAGHVSWHQDLKYWGLDGTAEVAAWVAFSRATVENGCMRFVPGSHRRGLVEHRDTYAEDNLLSRGQTLAIDVDESAAVPVVLAPGQLSLHHGHMFHASGPNHTDEWRIGLALHFIAPSMRQVVAPRDFAQVVRGEDRYGHFETPPRPRVDYDPVGMAAEERVSSARREAFFEGAARRPDTGVFVNEPVPVPERHEEGSPRTRVCS